MSENELTTEAATEPSNGIHVSESSSSEEKTEAAPKDKKPWIADGFKSRDEWRASKGQKTAKATPWIAAGFKSLEEWRVAAIKQKRETKVANKAAKKMAAPVKAKTKAVGKAKVKKAKTKKPAKLAAKPKSKDAKHKTPSAPGKGMVKDASLKPVAGADLSANVKKVFEALKKGKTATLEEIQQKAFPNLPHAKGSSRVRNQLRFLRVHKMVKRLGDGEYSRIA